MNEPEAPDEGLSLRGVVWVLVVVNVIVVAMLAVELWRDEIIIRLLNQLLSEL